MRQQNVDQCLRRRLAGIVLVVLAIACVVPGAGPVRADEEEESEKPADPRFPDENEGYTRLQATRVQVVAEGDYYTHRPTRCSIELSFAKDFANAEAWLHQRTNPVATLKRLEMGYEVIGDPRTSTDIRAFVRMRMERVDNGAPVRIERIVLDYTYGSRRNTVKSPSTAHWTGEALDADGYGKISIPIAQMDTVEVRDFNVALRIYGPVVAVTLPELGEDRAYAIPTAAVLGLKPALNACTCAFRNPRLNDRFVMNCAAPLLDPK